jgi:hypothetical protein
MSESEEKPFTFNDRRKLTSEGRIRDESPEPAGPGTPPEPVAPPAVGGAAQTEGEPEAATGASREPGAPRPAPGPVEFGPFLLSLAAQAGALLSGAGASDGLDAEDALAHAQSIIGVLEMLEDKTRGRRTADEDRLLEDLLFELRMAYVQKRRAGAP